MADPLLDAIDRAIAGLADTLLFIRVDFALAPLHQLHDMRAQKRMLFPTGTYAAGVWRPGDDIRLVCMSDNSPGVFWSLVAEKLGVRAHTSTGTSRRPTPSGRSTAANVTAPMPPDLQLEIPLQAIPLKHLSQLTTALGGSKFFLHSCSTPAGVNLSTLVLSGPRFGFDLFNKTDAASKNTCMVLAARHLNWARSRVAGVDRHFRYVYLRLYSWAVASGIFSGPLALLNSDFLLWYVWGVHWNWWMTMSRGETAPQATFFQYFFREDHSISEALATLRAYNEPIDVITHVRSLTLDQLSESARLMFSEASARVRQSNDVANALAITPEESFDLFRSRSGVIFVEVCGSSWASDSASHQLFEIQVLQSTVRAIANKIRETRSRWNGNSGRIVRLWPWPRARVEVGDHSEWTYILSVESSSTPNVAPSDSNLASREKELDILLDDIVKHIPHDKQWTSLYTERVSVENIPILLPPNPNSICENVRSPDRTLLSRKLRLGKRDDSSLSTHSLEPSTHLDPAKAVMARLRNHPEHKPIKYEVGWKDRFESMQWMPIDEWGWETEEEDFIPQHRIWYFRRATDRLVVWDRVNKLDWT